MGGADIRGSSLMVHPAAGLPELAVSRGLPLAILNAEASPLNHPADVLVHGRAGDVRSPAVANIMGM